MCVSAVSDSGERWTWFLNHCRATKTQRQCIEEIQEVVNNHDRVIAHNLSFDLKWLWALGIDTSDSLMWCTLVAEYVLEYQPRIQDLSLDDLCGRYGLPPKKDKVKVYWDAGIETDDIPADLLQVYCEQDAMNALLVYNLQAPRVVEREIIPLISVEMESAAVFAEMECNGMLVDVEGSKQRAQEADVELASINIRLCKLLDIDAVTSQKLSAGLFGGDLSYEYREQITDEEGNPVLYKSGSKKGLPKTRKAVGVRHLKGIGFNPKLFGIPEMATPGTYSTSKVYLPNLKARTPKQKEVLELIDRESKISKLLSGYYLSFPQLAVGGVVHPNLNQAITRTGRMSCSQPNLQNVPRGNTGPVKKLFISRFN